MSEKEQKEIVRLVYLLRKDACCPLDKGECFELAELLAKYCASCLEVEELGTIEVSLDVCKRILTTKDLNDFYAYTERYGDHFDYLFPEEEQDRIDKLFDDLNYMPGEYDLNNIKRILQIGGIL